MANDQTLQVVFSSADEAAAIKAVAADLNMPVSAYLRGLILARSRPVVAAWWYVGFDHEPRDKWRKQITAMLQGEITKTDSAVFSRTRSRARRRSSRVPGPPAGFQAVDGERVQGTGNVSVARRGAAHVVGQSGPLAHRTIDCKSAGA